MKVLMIQVDMESLKSLVRDIPDFPKPGVLFKDITPILSNGNAFKALINTFRDRYQSKNINAVVGIEARGFIFGASLAYALGAGLVIIRKPGKLPYKTYSETYTLEYGEDTMEIHRDAIQPNQNILILDDVLATGGTISASADLILKNFQANIIEAAFVIELDFLNGREKLKNTPIYSLVHY